MEDLTNLRINLYSTAMGFLSKKKDESRNSLPETRKPFLRQFDALFKQLRTVTDRVQRLEEALSTLRRDFNRIDRKVYRTTGASDETQDNGHKDGVSPTQLVKNSLKDNPFN